MIKNANKNIQKSIRMTESVYQAVDNFSGTGFNDKFENLVTFCIFRSDKIQHDIDNLNIRKEKVSKELDNLEEANRIIKSTMFQLVGIEETLAKLKERLFNLPVLIDSNEVSGM